MGKSGLRQVERRLVIQFFGHGFRGDGWRSNAARSSDIPSPLSARMSGRLLYKCIAALASSRVFRASSRAFRLPSSRMSRIVSGFCSSLRRRS